MSTAALSLDERVAARIGELSPSELRIAAFMRAHPDDVAFLSVTGLAGKLETSDATVIRTAQALGYTGIPDLRRELIEQLRARMSPALRLSKSLEGLSRSPDAFLDTAFETQIELLRQARQALQPESFAKAVGILADARRVLAFGTGVAGHLAAVFATRLQRMGHDALSINATGAALADSLLTMRTRDALLALVNEQAPTESKLVLEEARRRGLPVVLVTDTQSAVFAEQVTVALVAPRGDAATFKSLSTAGVLLDVLLLGVAARAPGAALRAMEDFGRLRAQIVGQNVNAGPRTAD